MNIVQILRDYLNRMVSFILKIVMKNNDYSILVNF